MRFYFHKRIVGRQTRRTNSGQAVLIAVIFFLFISSTIVLGIASPILKQVRISTDLIHSKQAYYLAEGALEDAIYRVKNSKNIISGEVVTVGGYATTVTLTTTSNGKIIDAVSNRGGIVRKMESQITTGVGEDFNYGIQAGAGGFNLSGGATINGNVYANGSIIANGGASITGSAIAADPVSTTTDQSNATPVPISSCTSSTCITFGNTSGAQDAAQSFSVSQSVPLSQIAFYIKKVGSPSDITVEITTNNSGAPASTALLTGTLSASSIGTSFAWATTTITTNTPILDPTQTYWIVLNVSATNSSNYYIVGANSSYSGGTAQLGQYGGSWSNTSPAGLDLYFQTYLGGGYSYIGGGTYVGAVNIGTGSIGNASAHTVMGANVAGSLYCQTGSNNNKTCNTTQPDPSPVSYPLSSANIQEWENEGAAATGQNFSGGWTYTGNLTVNYMGTTSTLTEVNGNLSLQCSSAPATFGNLYVTGTLTVSSGCQFNANAVRVGSDLTVDNNGATLGALEADGNVTVTSGGVLSAGPVEVAGNLNVQSTFTMTGTVWVVGDVTVSSGATVQLGSTYGANSGTLISNGYMNLSGGGTFKGSGQSTSFPMLVTTSDCPVSSSCGGNSAITIAGGAGAVVLDAQNGTINMSGGTGAEALTANQIVLSGGANVTYNSGLANLNFSSGPSGGYSISTWKEVQ